MTERIGRYEIVKQLGRGGMAAVYLGHDPLIKRDVAIKVMFAQLMASDPTFFDRFQNEAETIASLEHPAIVPIYDFGHQGDQSYIVMRYMPGGTLEPRISAGSIKLQDTASIIERVAGGLDEAHSKGIVHRDIKPANILFSTDGKAFLSDFGIAKNTETSGLTADNSMIGTVEYMSPEQIQGVKDIDGRTDVYSLGIVLFFMLTGKLPFKRDTMVSTIMAHLTEPVPSVQAALPKSRLPWDDILAKALAKDPSERYQTAGDMARDVNSLLSGKWYLSKLLE
jgi:serine/threonine protein kinase